MLSIYLQTWNQFVSEHRRRFMDNNFNEDLRNVSAHLFDAIWTAALALNRTAARLKRVNLSLMDFDYEDAYRISDIIYDEARKAQFFGLTVSFRVTLFNAITRDS